VAEFLPYATAQCRRCIGTLVRAWHVELPLFELAVKAHRAGTMVRGIVATSGLIVPFWPCLA